MRSKRSYVVWHVPCCSPVSVYVQCLDLCYSQIIVPVKHGVSLASLHHGIQVALAIVLVEPLVHSLCYTLSIALSLSKGDGGLSRAELLGSYRPPSLVSTFANGEHLRKPRSCYTGLSCVVRNGVFQTRPLHYS